MILKYVNLIFLFTFIIGCSPVVGPQYIDEDDLIPPRPSIFSYFPVYGEDVDNDGVRDDIELYINKNFDDINLRRSLKHYIKNLGEYSKTDNSEVINRLFLERIDSSVCIGVLDGGRTEKNLVLENDMYDRFANNVWRRMNLRKKGRMVKSGTHDWGGANIMANLKRCKIAFKDLHKTLQFYLNTDYKYGMSEEEIRDFEKIFQSKL